MLISERDAGQLNVVEFHKSDFLFHEILYNESGNMWIAKIQRNLRLLIDVIRGYSFRVFSKGRMMEVANLSIKEHREIIGFLKKHEIEGAVQALRTHINNHKERVKKEYALLK